MQREDTDYSEASSDRTLELEGEEPPPPAELHQGQQNGSNGSADAGVTSDEEERDIIREIREEIKRNVREDIREELAKYDLKNLSSRTESVASSHGGDPGDGLPSADSLLPERDIKYQEAYQKMLKLDRILRKRMAREREVKRDRAMLEKRIKEELEQLKNAATSRRSNDELTNTMKFLALTPAEGAEAGLDDEYSEPHTPVFPTEYLFDEGGVNADAAAASATARSSGGDGGGGGSSARRQKQKRQLPKDRKAAASGAGADASKDFIRRNIELAAASSDVVAMTPEERERLDALLRDLDAIPELPEEFLDSSGGNPYHQQLALPPGEGYRSSDDEARRLREIEAGLARLGSVPPPQLASSRRDSTGTASQSELLLPPDGLSSGYRATALQRMQAGQDWDLDRLGEKALAEVKEDRLMSHRLDEVNSRLALLSNESSQGPLTADQMSSLLSDCARSIGHSQLGSHRGLQSAAATASTVSVVNGVGGDSPGRAADTDWGGGGGNGSASSRLADDADYDGHDQQQAGMESLMLEVPPLDRGVLDRLLTEARAAGIGQNWIRPEPITEEEEEEDGDEDEGDEMDEFDSDDEDATGQRLVLPDISLFANMSAPKTPNSGRYSAG